METKVKKKWKNDAIDWEEADQWAKAFQDDFEPENVSFYLWLKDIKKITPQSCADEWSRYWTRTLKQTRRESLLEEYKKNLEKGQKSQIEVKID